jgi:hypothetical protein
MAVVLITGNPGSGKTAVSRELARLGHAALDADEIAHHETHAGVPVHQPQQPTREWLASHRWVWGRTQLDAAIIRHLPSEGHLFVCGIAMDLQELLDLFDLTFLLSLDAATQISRLDAPSNAHRNSAERQEIIDGLSVFEERMRALGAVVLDGRLPTPVVAETVLQQVGERFGATAPH